jgi:hypothetical protein
MNKVEMENAMLPDEIKTSNVEMIPAVIAINNAIPVGE